jgi:N utilization substance protein A
MQTQFIAAINQICDEKNLSKEVVVDTVEAALAAAYKKDYGDRDQEVTVKLDEETGNIDVTILKEVSEEIENPYLQISPAEAKKIKKTAKVGETVEIHDTPSDFGRIAAQTAKQVIIQRIREAEREVIFEEYKDREGDLINGVVQRLEGPNVVVDIGKTNAIMFPNEQIPGERYYIGQRLRLYVVRVEQTSRGTQIVVSRSHPGMVQRLFELEVPEITANTVEIKGIVREAGARSKVAVWSDQPGVDPVGSCVGQRGTRVQAVMAELGEEKIDIILWDEDPKVFITNALSPAKVLSVDLKEAEKRASVNVPEDQLSLAIGRSGQNVRLAAKLTGWNVDIIGADSSGIEKVEQAQQEVQKKPGKAPRVDVEGELIKAVEQQNQDDVSEEAADLTVAAADDEELAKPDEAAEQSVENPPLDDTPSAPSEEELASSESPEALPEAKTEDKAS